MRDYGVSPAFISSLWSTRFSVANVHESLPLIRELGFNSFQPEIYYPETLDDWCNGGAKQIAQRAADLGLGANVFVAHFLMERFESEERMAAEDDLEQLERAVEVARTFKDCRVLCVPLPRFQVGARARQTLDSHREFELRLAQKLHGYLSLVAPAGLALAIEILPFSAIGHYDHFLRLAESVGSSRFGLLVDTGHAWAMREVMEVLPFKLAGRLFGLHLKDNNSDVNQPLAPGKGTIPWTAFLRNLREAGYSGSLDIEIGCAPDRVRTEYSEGLSFLKSLGLDEPAT